jgi:hypothetical protein
MNYLHTAVRILSFLLAVGSICAATNFNVVTWQYDQARTGLNPSETVLKPANVRPETFGKLFHQDVLGYVFAQPLYMSGISIPGKGIHNVVFVATERDIVYAFDADDNSGPNAEPLWVRSFIDPAAGISTVPISEVNLTDPPEIGITSTPVIDVASGTIYVVTKTKEITGSSRRHVLRLHALDIHTGAIKASTELKGSVPGTGDASVGGVITFDATYHFNRPALLLVNGFLYIAFGTQGDIQPSHGWIMVYNAATLQQRAIFNDTPNGTLGGIWMSGAGLSADTFGNIYGITGNGTFSADKGGKDYGDSFLKMKLDSEGLTVLDYFTPYNQEFLSNIDADLGSGVALILPDSVGSVAHPRLMVGCGKQGKIYLLDRDNLGKFNPKNDSQAVQSFLGIWNGAWSSPAYFNGRLYFQGFNDLLRAFAISNAYINPTAISLSRNTVGYPGLTPCVSANGTNDAIVWAIQADAYSSSGPAILRAYDAYDLNNELYNSSVQNSRDTAGQAMKFTTPTVANGKVYVPTGYGLYVYGLFQPPRIVTQPVATEAILDSTVTLTVEAAGGGLLRYQWKKNGVSIEDANDVSLVLQDVKEADSGTYTVEVSNEYGTVTSAPVILTVKPTLGIKLYPGLRSAAK